MSSANYDRVTKAIRIYEDSVTDALKGLKIKAIIDVFFVLLTLILIVLAIFFSNLAGLLTTLGFGGLTVSSQGQAWIAAVKSYINSSSALRRGVNRLKEQIALCDKTDDDCLNNVKCLIQEQFNALDEAANK